MRKAFNLKELGAFSCVTPSSPLKKHLGCPEHNELCLISRSIFGGCNVPDTDRSRESNVSWQKSPRRVRLFCTSNIRKSHSVVRPLASHSRLARAGSRIDLSGGHPLPLRWIYGPGRVKRQGQPESVASRASHGVLRRSAARIRQPIPFTQASAPLRSNHSRRQLS